MDYFDQFSFLKPLLSYRRIIERKRHHFCDYFEFSNSALYEDCFQWTTKNAALHEGIVSLPFFLYFFNKKENDAFAYQFEQMNIIGISTGFFENLLARCDEKGPEMERVALLQGINIRNLANQSAAEFIFIVARHFVYFHEFAHLIQQDDIVNGELPKADQYCSQEEKLTQDHVKERDADIFGANLTMSQIQLMFKSYHPQYQTAQTLEQLVVLSQVALYLVFDILSDGLKKPIYYEETDHPHHVIRINLLQKMMSSKANNMDGVGALNIFNILPRTLAILSALNEKSLNRFVHNMNTYGGQIDEYEKKYKEEIEQHKWTAGAKMEIWHNSKFR